MSRNLPLTIRALVVTLLSLQTAVYAVNKADNTTNLNLGASWTGGTAPGVFDVAQWTNTVSAASAATALSLGANISWGGITIANPGGDITIGTGNTLTLGYSTITGQSINMSAATQNLTIRSGLTLLSGTSQGWTVGTGRILTLSDGVFTRGAGATLNIQGGGTITTTNITNVNGIVGPWATVGTGTAMRYATVDASNNIVAYTGGTAAAAGADITDTTGTVNYDLAAGGALGAGASFNTIRYTGAAGSLTGNLSINGVLNTGTGMVSFGGAVAIGGARDLTLYAATGDITISGNITNNAGGASSLTKAGTGTVYLTGSNSYTGMTVINSGVLDVGNLANGSLGTGGLLINGNGILQGYGTFTRSFSGNVTPGANQVAGQNGGFAARGGELILNFGGNATPTAISLNGSGYIFGNDFRFGSATANNKVVVLNPIVINSNGRRAFTVTAGAGGDSAELRGVLSDGAAGFFPSGINKNGNGILQLSAANTYTGATQISAGTLSIATVANGGTASNLGASSNAAGNLLFDGGTLRYTGVTASTDRSFTITAGKTATIDVTTASTNLTITGSSTATTGAFAKTGAGTLTLTGTMLNTGTTSITGGVLDIGPMTSLGSGGLFFSNNGILQGNGTLTRTFSGNATPAAGQLAGVTGGFAARGGPLTLNLGTLIGLNTSLNIFGTNLIFGSPTADSRVELTSNINLNSATSDRTVTVNSGLGGDHAVLSGILSENAGGVSGLTKNGTGLLVLSGANTYTRSTTVNAGTLIANYTGANAAASSTGTGPVTIAASATLGGFGKVGTGSSLVTVNGRLSPGDSTLADTRDTLTISGSLTLGTAAVTQLDVGSLTDLDRVVTTGTVTLDGTVNVDFSTFASSNFASSFTLDLFDWANLIATGFTVGDGGFGDLKLLNIDLGGNTGSWDFSQFLNTGLNGGSIIWNVAVVPEPSRMLLLVAGITWMAGRRRRR